MFGFSMGEFLLICVVALVFVGPQKLPGVLRTLGQWIRKARSMVYDMRAQSGIDDILRAEGLHGGMSELRSLMRGGQHIPPYVPPADAAATAEPTPSTPARPQRGYEPAFGFVDLDPTKEYPPEGPDAYGALPDDLFDEPRIALSAPTPAGDPAPPSETRESAPDEPAPPAQSAPAA